MHVLVTGITGYVGSVIAARLRATAMPCAALPARPSGWQPRRTRGRRRRRHRRRDCRRRWTASTSPTSSSTAWSRPTAARSPRVSRPPSASPRRRARRACGASSTSAGSRRRAGRDRAPGQPAGGGGHPARRGARLSRAPGLHRHRRTLTVVSLPRQAGGADAGPRLSGVAAQPHRSGRRARHRRRAGPFRHRDRVAGRRLDVGGPDLVSYGELIARIADLMLVDRPALRFKRLRRRPSPAGWRPHRRRAVGARRPPDGEPGHRPACPGTIGRAAFGGEASHARCRDRACASRLGARGPLAAR